MLCQHLRVVVVAVAVVIVVIVVVVVYLVEPGSIWSYPSRYESGSSDTLQTMWDCLVLGASPTSDERERLAPPRSRSQPVFDAGALYISEWPVC